MVSVRVSLKLKYGVKIFQGKNFNTLYFDNLCIRVSQSKAMQVETIYTFKNYVTSAPCQAFSVSWVVLALTEVAEFFVVFMKSVGLFFQNDFIVLVLKGLHFVGATVANTHGMSVENTLRFVTGRKMFVKES